MSGTIVSLAQNDALLKSGPDRPMKKKSSKKGAKKAAPFMKKGSIANAYVQGKR